MTGIAKHITLSGAYCEDCRGDLPSFNATMPVLDQLFSLHLCHLKAAVDAQKARSETDDGEVQIQDIEDLIAKNNASAGETSVMTPAIQACHAEAKANYRVACVLTHVWYVRFWYSGVI